jgi:hypothetical protein
MTAHATLEQRPASDDRAKVYKPFFRGETLNRDTPIFLAEGEPITAGLTLPDSGSQEHLIVARRTD